jgi:hypothetical protein
MIIDRGCLLKENVCLKRMSIFDDEKAESSDIAISILMPLTSSTPTTTNGCNWKCESLGEKVKTPQISRIFTDLAKEDIKIGLFWMLCLFLALYISTIVWIGCLKFVQSGANGSPNSPYGSSFYK